MRRWGSGPAALLLHGTGASVHSWTGLAELLANDYSVVAIDLPGHGASHALARAQMSLPGIAGAIGALMREIEVDPVLVIGHSAGAALLVQLTLDHAIHPRLIVSLNGALLPPPGPAGAFFSPLAKLLAFTPFVPQLFSARAGKPAAVERLVAATGSRLTREQVDHYARLIGDPVHVAGVLAMMAGWDLRPLVERLPQLNTPLLLIVAEGDRTVPPAHAQQIQAIVPQAARVSIPGLGHLAHEEQPSAVHAAMASALRAAGLLSDGAQASRLANGGARDG